MKDKLAISIDNSLNWLHSHLAYFTLPAIDEQEDPFIDSSRKRFGELALSLSILSRHHAIPSDYRFQAIVTHIKQWVEREEFYFNMSRNLELFPFYLTVLNGLRSVNIRFPEYDFILQQVIDGNFMDLIERNNWNKIDFLYNLNCAGLHHHMPLARALYKYSSLFYLPAIAHLRTIDAYALTHIIFHLSDFGLIDVQELLGSKYEDTRAYVALLTGLYDYYNDYDLLAELLICCHNLRLRNFPLFSLHWSNLLCAQNSDGSFTSRYVQQQPNKKLDAYGLFKLNYHPTLVSLFACVLEHTFLQEHA